MSGVKIKTTKKAELKRWLQQDIRHSSLRIGRATPPV
jgi:hypothetical protein